MVLNRRPRVSIMSDRSGEIAPRHFQVIKWLRGKRGVAITGEAGHVLKRRIAICSLLTQLCGCGCGAPCWIARSCRWVTFEGAHSMHIPLYVDALMLHRTERIVESAYGCGLQFSSRNDPRVLFAASRVLCASCAKRL
jgi:hypothetical protein